MPSQSPCALISLLPFFRQQMKKLNNEIFATTSSDIKKLSSIVKFASNDGSKTNRLMLEKLVDEFHVIGEKYLSAEKILDMKMRKCLLVNVGGDLEESDDENVNVSLQQQKLMNADLKSEVEVMKTREEDVKTIEKNVIDINQMMKEISTMIEGLFEFLHKTTSILDSYFLSIAEQGENVETIAGTVSHVADDVEGGISELEKASNYQQKFRRKLLIILIIAICVALIVVFSLYSKLKN